MSFRIDACWSFSDFTPGAKAEDCEWPTAACVSRSSRSRARTRTIAASRRWRSAGSGPRQAVFVSTYRWKVRTLEPSSGFDCGSGGRRPSACQSTGAMVGARPSSRSKAARAMRWSSFGSIPTTCCRRTTCAACCSGRTPSTFCSWTETRTPIRASARQPSSAHALDVAPRIGRSFAVETLDAQDLSESAIIRSDVLVLANATLDEKWLPLIQRFVGGGGSLWITAGDRINPRAYGSVLRELLPGRYTATRMEDRPLSLSSDALPELDQAKVRGRTPIAEASLDAVVTARFSDGAPAMVEHRYRSGRVAMFATTIDDAWTDLPYQPVFVPFVLDTLAPSGGTHRAFGRTLWVRVAPRVDAEPAHPGRDADRPHGRSRGGGPRGVPRHRRDRRLSRAGQRRQRCALRVRRRRAAGESDLVARGRPSGEHAAKPSIDASSGVEQPLAPWLLLLASPCCSASFGCVRFAEGERRARCG